MAKARVLSVAAAVILGGLVNAARSITVQAAEAPEPAVGGTGPEGDYLRTIHQRLHPKWAEGYIRISPYKQLGPSTSQRQAEVSFVIRWDGTVDHVEITKSSEVPEYDTAALNAVWFAAPFPPPVDVMADDGLVHLKWRFARNYRLCSGAEVTHVEFPLQIALPSLASRGQLGEAVRRMSEELARQGWSQDFLSPFVRQWLGRSNLSSELDARAAAALAIGGDRQQQRLLEPLLLTPQTAGIAAVAMERLGMDVGGALMKSLQADASGGDGKRPAVLAAVRATPAALSRCLPCSEILARAVLDPRQPVRARVEMIEILGRLAQSEGVAAALSRASHDTNASIRGAALLALMPPGRGRIGVIRMATLLHDPLPEIRAAAAAGVLRAGGDTGIEQLFLLGRERDPRPLIAAAGELGKMSSTDSADLLRRLLKRTESPVRVAVVTALATRTDEAARGLVDPILAAARANASEEPAVRVLALSGASKADLVAMSADHRLGLAGYRGLLRAQLREDAARWLLANVEQLSPEDRISALGEWIAVDGPKLTTAAQQ